MDEIKWDSPFSRGGFGGVVDPSRLLEPGEWSWRLNGENGADLDSGTVRIEAEQDTTIVVDFGDPPLKRED